MTPLLNQEGILGVLAFGKNVLMAITKGYHVQEVPLTNPWLESWHIPIITPTVFNNPSPTYHRFADLRRYLVPPGVFFL